MKTTEQRRRHTPALCVIHAGGMHQDALPQAGQGTELTSEKDVGAQAERWEGGGCHTHAHCADQDNGGDGVQARAVDQSDAQGIAVLTRSG